MFSSIVRTCRWSTWSNTSRMAEAGQLSPSLDMRRFTLDNVDTAYELITESKAQGKLSIDIEEAAHP